MHARWLPMAVAALAAFGAAPAAAADKTVIDLTYDSVMDMVRPEIHPALFVHHDLHVTISGYAALSEQRDRSARQYSDRNAMMQVLDSKGDETSYASWKTQPDGSLQRIEHDPQSTRWFTVTFLPGNTCRLDIVNKLNPGFSEYKLLRISTHTYAYFSTYRVVATSCAMHS